MKLFATIKPEFREEMRQYPVTVHKELNKWTTIKKIQKNNGEDYYFMERAGVDSVAFILVDKNSDKPFGLINQFRGQSGKFIKGAYTGSLDKPELSLDEIVLEEVKEESGYVVDLGRITFISKEIAGAMTNEQINLYVVDVTGLQPEELEPESVFEENTENLWFTYEEAMNKTEDWKVKLILHTITV